MSPGPRSRLRRENVDGVIVVSFTDTKIVAEDQIQEVGDELYALVEDSTKKKILLNFGNVQYCSSTVLGKLVSLKRRVDAAKGKLKLCCIHPDLLVPFKLTGLDKVFEIHAEEQAALSNSRPLECDSLWFAHFDSEIMIRHLPRAEMMAKSGLPEPERAPIRQSGTGLGS